MKQGKYALSGRKQRLIKSQIKKRKGHQTSLVKVDIMKTMHERYENVTPMGTMALCNTFGIAIFKPDEVDCYKDNCDLIAAWHNGEIYSNFHKHKIHYTQTDRAYICKGSMRIYLDEVMKIA